MDNRLQSGAVSIFAVVFSALLLTVLTVGFIGLMISGQQRAVNNDLSQSAYDAALAGAEDAKRAVRACIDGVGSVCGELDSPHDCKVIARAGITGSAAADETIIRSSSGDASRDGTQFDQAYTCVNITMDTPDYRDEVREGQSRIVPLRANGAFNRVVVEWFTQDDAGAGVQATRPTTGSDFGILPPNTAGGWDAAAPPLMRVQVISPGSSFSLASLDQAAASQTVFLRPSTVANGPRELAVPMSSFARATDPSGGGVENRPVPIICSRNFANNGHSCRAILELNEEVSVAASGNALLRLNAMYKGANIRVSLMAADGSTVLFDGVQPMVDSTGRANNLFRRVEARLMIGDDFPYPSYAVDVNHDLCKSFSISEDGSPSPGPCTP